MPRRARLIGSGLVYHVIQRGNNRLPCFHDPGDFRFYLECLREGAQRYRCAVHAYVLMTNHVHLLLGTAEEAALAQLMRYLGSRYVQRFNRVHQRTGTLWEARFRSSIIDSERYLFACYRYIELNPVRGGLVQHPQDYRWSSYGRHAERRPDELIHDHGLFLDLGKTDTERASAYRALFDKPLDGEVLGDIRASLNSGLVLGDEHFKDAVERVLGRRVRQRRAGRPPKSRHGRRRRVEEHRP